MPLICTGPRAGGISRQQRRAGARHRCRQGPGPAGQEPGLSRLASPRGDVSPPEHRQRPPRPAKRSLVGTCAAFGARERAQPARCARQDGGRVPGQGAAAGGEGRGVST